MQLEMAQKLAALSSEHTSEIEELRKKYDNELEETREEISKMSEANLITIHEEISTILKEKIMLQPD